MKTSLRIAKAQHEVVYQELADLVRRHANEMTALEVLAIVANMVGKLIAMQDQRKISPAMALKIVGENIEYGNQQALDEIGKSQGSA